MEAAILMFNSFLGCTLNDIFSERDTCPSPHAAVQHQRCSVLSTLVLCFFFLILLLQILWRTQLVMLISSSRFDATAFTGEVERITWQFISMSFRFFS